MADHSTTEHPRSVVDCALYEDGRRRPGLLPLSQAMEAAQAKPGSFVWIGLHEPSVDQLQVVADAFALHPLAVEDAVKAHQRPKLEMYDETLFLVLKTTVYVEHDRLTPTSDVVDTGEIMAFMGANFVVVVRHGPSRRLTGVRARLEVHPELLVHGPAAVLHAVTDAVVDQYLEVVQAVETDVEEVEAQAFSPEPTHDVARIYQLKRELLELRRAVAPLSQPLYRLSEGRLPGIDTDIAAYLRDVHDHLGQACERIATLMELVDTSLTLTLAQTSVRQSHDVRRISAIAAIIAVPIMIFGVYGMNFDHMPELVRPLGYPIALLVTAAVCAVVYWAFHRKHWL
ncbi:magnesium and cobalt transport protein CorA [Streptomyces sp. NPDC006208]|uniref:magnesium and cobalt transport protein CorA n=1 Tax=Streptomyces sp. NPDC006208 TaxID=3156734 RepID=UPI0033B1CE19